jgi:2-methylcitrate dehydratase PrpD
MLPYAASACIREFDMPDQSSLSDQICLHASSVRFSQLPPRTVEFARFAVLDGLGVMLAASGLSVDAVPFANLALAAGGRPQASLIGRGSRVPMAAAALANGALSHALDYEDAFDAAPTHPNASLLPAAFAICEADPSLSGADLLAAVAVGCDLVCRFALAVRQPLEAGGWYPPPIFGAFGATAAVARLLRLDAARTRDAFSLLLCQNVCPGEIKYSRDTVMRAVREAFPAQAAVNAGLLAREGTRGFEEPFEGKAGFFQLFAGGKFDPEELTRDLGRQFWIEQLSFKPWPCCRGTHAFIEAAAHLAARPGFDPAEIDAIKLEGAEVHRMLMEPGAQRRAPRTAIDAKFSLPFTVALALHGDPVNLGSFSPEALTDQRILSLAAKTAFESVPRFKGQAAAGGVTLKFINGLELKQDVLSAAGAPDRPLSREQLIAKFLDCAIRASSPVEAARAATSAARILRLEAEPQAGALLSELSRDPSSQTVGFPEK